MTAPEVPTTWYVGIDPGTSCGWAVLTRDGSYVASGAWDLAPRRHEGGGMRYLRARRLLGELLGTERCVLAYEEVRRHRGTDAAHVYGGIVGQITALCEERRVPFQGIPVATAKRAATGRGDANKAAMKDAALERWGVLTATDDEADALWLAEALRLQLGGM